MIDFASNVVAGTVLVRSAIQSPNFVAGISGWSINQDGSVEFSDATIRGTVIAGGGNVVLNSSGLDVFDSTLPYEYLVNRSAGFYARNVPDDGGHTQMYPENIVWWPQDPTPHGNDVTSGGLVNTNITNPSGVVERVNLQIKSPALQSRPQSVILLEGESTAGDLNKISLLGEVLHITGYVEDHDLIDIRDHEYLRGESEQFLISFGPAASATTPVTFAHQFSQAPEVNCNIASFAGPTSNWHARATAITSSGFTYTLFGPSATWTNVPVSWIATEYTP